MAVWEHKSCSRWKGVMNSLSLEQMDDKVAGRS